MQLCAKFPAVGSVAPVIFDGAHVDDAPQPGKAIALRNVTTGIVGGQLQLLFHARSRWSERPDMTDSLLDRLKRRLTQSALASEPAWAGMTPFSSRFAGLSAGAPRGAWKTLRGCDVHTRACACRVALADRRGLRPRGRHGPWPCDAHIGPTQSMAFGIFGRLSTQVHTLTRSLGADLSPRHVPSAQVSHAARAAGGDRPAVPRARGGAPAGLLRADAPARAR